ncbi:hypothetical protein CLOP_g2324, partial [Closterium sp. NIES-67]
LTARAGQLETLRAGSDDWRKEQLFDGDRDSDLVSLSPPLHGAATSTSIAGVRAFHASALGDITTKIHGSSRSDLSGISSSSSSRSEVRSSGKPQWPNRPHVFDLADFGGVGDGATDNTRALQNAVYAVSTVADKGGGQLYVPPGVYRTGSVNLTSAMTLFLARGATILGNPDPALWPVIPPLPSYGRGREMPGPRYSSLLHCHNLTDVVITGDNGVVDGAGAAWWQMKRAGVLKHSRGALIEAMWTSGVTVANVTLRDAPAWALHPVYCDHVQVSNVTITAPPDSPNTIGIVIDSSEDVLIEGVTVLTGGGGISIKSGWDEYGLAFARPTHAVTIQDSHIESPLATALSIGSEMSGGVHALRCRHVSIAHSRAAFHLRTAPGRGGYIRDVLLEDVTMLNVTVALAFLPTCRSHPDDHFDPAALPRVSNISFASISGSLISEAGRLIGLAAAPFTDVSLSDVNLQLVEGGKGFSCQHVDGHARNVSPAICPELSAIEAGPLECGGCSSFRGLGER